MLQPVLQEPERGDMALWPVCAKHTNKTAFVCCSFPALVRMRGRTAYIQVASLLSTLASSFDLSLKVGLDASCAAVKPAAYLGHRTRRQVQSMALSQAGCAV